MKNKGILTIAGNDIYSAGGLYSDIKVFSALNQDHYLVVSCLTADGPSGFEIFPVSLDVLKKQLQTFDSIPLSLVKIGLLPTLEHVRLVFDWLDSKKEVQVYLDPVLVLKEKEGAAASPIVREILRFLPKVDLLTPNLGEAQLLLARKLENRRDLEAAARDLRELGAKNLVITLGGRLGGEKALDLVFDGQDMEWLEGPLVKGSNEGAGCTFMSHLAASRQAGMTVKDAALKAKRATYDYLLERNKE